MRRRLILPLLAAAVLATPVHAAEEKKNDENGLYVDLAQTGLPVIQNGRLVNYVFVHVRLNLTPGSNPVQLRTREPFFRDALVRAAHRTPFVVAGEPNKLDEAALKRVMMVEAAKIAGPRAIASVLVVDQAPKRFIPK
ncbi:MAG TPA: hypothetical protein VL358_08315 [Caulobacteraceae bacterium]|jgi:hypothetical protein|nr:hypothetical protein [Caulobacteraceae bacterium]